MNSQLAEFDWGPHCSIAWRRPLAAGLLFHAGLQCLALPPVIDAFAAEVVAEFSEWGWSITRDQILDWMLDYQLRQKGQKPDEHRK